MGRIFRLIHVYERMGLPAICFMTASDGIGIACLSTVPWLLSRPLCDCARIHQSYMLSPEYILSDQPNLCVTLRPLLATRKRKLGVE
jgi:hypothetical protein